MLEPKTITVKTQSGEDREYTISKFPAIAGREIVAKYPISGMPKIGDYAVNEETMLKLMAYVGVNAGGETIMLSTRALVDNHIPDWEALAKIEMAMMEHNCSFFANGKISNFFDNLKQNASKSITKMLTDSLGQLLQMEKQRSKN